MSIMNELINKLATEHSLTLAEYKLLVESYNEENARELAELAVAERKKYYSNTVYIRGLIEISNICKNNCLYCGIRRDNRDCERYRLNKEEILSCCEEGYELGFRTFVMQGGAVGRDLYVWRDLLPEVSEQALDREAAYLLGFQKNMVQKYMQ